MDWLRKVIFILLLALPPMKCYTTPPEADEVITETSSTELDDATTFDFQTTTTTQAPAMMTPSEVEIFPDHGPQAGGTRLTITQLSQPRKVEAVFLILPSSAYEDCEIIERKGNKVIALTPPYDGVVTCDVGLSVAVTGRNITLNTGHKFTYKPNPGVTNIQPNVTLVGGGTKLTVSGTSIDAVAEPKINFGVEHCYVIGQQAKFTELCSVNNAESMFCKTPNVSVCNTTTSESNTGLSSNEVKLLLSILGFVFDGDSNYDDLKKHPNLPSVVAAYEPPELMAQNSTLQFKKGSPLEIRGDHMDRGVTAGDYVVFVGEGECLVSAEESLFQSVLLCTPPAPIPKKSNITHGKYHRVLVNIGNYKYYYGEVWYPWWTHPAFIPGVAAAGILLIIIFLALAVACRPRKPRREPEVDREEFVSLPPVMTEEMEEAKKSGKIFLPRPRRVTGRM